MYTLVIFYFERKNGDDKEIKDRRTSKRRSGTYVCNHSGCYNMNEDLLSNRIIIKFSV